MGRYQELGKKTQQQIPGSKLVEIENVGHLPHIEAYDKFWNALYDFIKVRTHRKLGDGSLSNVFDFIFLNGKFRCIQIPPPWGWRKFL
ncbi:hypothetical protein [Chryseobacterium wanjuense]